MFFITESKGTFFICDTNVNPGPTAEQIAKFTVLAADTVRFFGIKPRIALLNVGLEEHKGNDILKQTYDILKNNKIKNF